MLKIPAKYKHSGIKIWCTDCKISSLNFAIGNLITKAGFQDPRITNVYWPDSELFKPAKEKDDSSQDGESDSDGDEIEEGNDKE
jgi:hypothetical protein